MYTRAVPEEGDRAYFAPLRICLRREAGQPTAVLELSAILIIVPFCTRPHRIPLRVRFVMGQRAGIMKLKRTRPFRVSGRSARARRSAGQPSVRAVSAVSLVLPTASRVRRLSISMSVPALEMCDARSSLKWCHQHQRWCTPLTEGEMTPVSVHSCGGWLVTNGVRASGCQHPVQDRHAHGGFRLLGSEATCS